MPIFEYECAKCRKAFEVLATSGSSERVACPRCSSRRVRRKISGFSVGKGKGRVLAGSGEAKGSSSCRSCASRNCSTCR